MNVIVRAKMIACIRSFGFWVRECDEGSPVKYIVVDPDGGEDGWMAAGDDRVLLDTIDKLEIGNPEAVSRELGDHRP